MNVASSGVGVGGDRVTVRDNRVRNVRFGISVSGEDARIQGNLDRRLLRRRPARARRRRAVRVQPRQNNYVDDPPDPNHDDGFQSWSVGPGGVGTGEVRGVVLRGNVFVNSRTRTSRCAARMQGIGCFDGFFVDWVVENNVVITDHWHGISFLGMRDSRIVNNTVIDVDRRSPGPPWIMVNAAQGRPPQRERGRAQQPGHRLRAGGHGIVADHNIEFTRTPAPTSSPRRSTCTCCRSRRPSTPAARTSRRRSTSSASRGRRARASTWAPTRDARGAHISQVVRSRRPLDRLLRGQRGSSRENSQAGCSSQRS